MSTVIFTSQRKPEKHLIQETTYTYRPDSEMKERILEDLKKHLNCSLDGYIIDLNVQISLKEYDTKNT